MMHARVGAALAALFAFATVCVVPANALAQDEKAPPAAELLKELDAKLVEVQKHQKAWQKHQDSADLTGKDDEERKQKRIAFGKEGGKLLARVTRALASVDRILRPLSEAKKDETKGVTPEHFIGAVQRLIDAEQAGRGARMAAQAIAVFPKDFEVRVQHGNAMLSLAMEMGDDAFYDMVEAAEKSFLRARAINKESAKPWFGLYQVQEALGEDEKALEHLDAALEKKGADDEVDRPRIRRGQLLMRLGKMKDAARQFDTSLARKQDAFQACVLAARCYVLEGDAKRAERVFGRLEKSEGETIRVVQAKADMLYALGKVSDARNLLAASVPPKKAGESFEELHERQSAESMACLMESMAKGKLEAARKKLPAILGIQFFTMMPSKSDPEVRERRNVDQNPTFMLYELGRTEKTAQYWAEEVLATLCQQALTSYESSDSEKFIEVQLYDYDEREELRSKESWDMQLEYLESYLATPDFRGALLARELCQKAPREIACLWGRGPMTIYFAANDGAAWRRGEQWWAMEIGCHRAPTPQTSYFWSSSSSTPALIPSCSCTSTRTWSVRTGLKRTRCHASRPTP